MTKSEVLIDEATSPSHIEERIGVGEDEKLRTSSRRESYLKRFTRVMTGTGVDLRLHPEAADTNFEQDPPRIRIPAPPDAFPQSVTDYRPKVYDMIVQETISLHEAGHVLYTDWGIFKEVVEDIDKEYRGVFKDIWNLFEDGAIEEQLRNEFNCADELLIVNTNTVVENTFGTQISPGEINYTFHNATTAALVDLCIVNSGTLEKLIDEDDERHILPYEDDRELFKDFLPTIKQSAAGYISEPDAEKRMDILLDFWQEYVEYIDEAEIGGRQSASNSEDTAVIQGKGDDGLDGYDLRGMEESNQDATFDANQLPDQKELEERMDVGGEDDQESEDGDFSLDSIGGDIDEAQELDEGTEDKFEEEVSREAKQESDSMMDEAMEYLDMFEEGSDGATDSELEDLQIGVAQEDDSWAKDRWDEARRQSRMIENVLRRRLRRERRTKVKRNRRRGNFDTRRMITAKRGSPRVFEKESDPDEKEYNCMIVVDRSGSMSGKNIEMAESGAGAFLRALENLNIDTSLMDLYSSTPRVAIPFNDTIENHRSRLFTQDTSGGTPLSDAIRLANERMQKEAEKFPFMIVITDGRPASPDEYKEALDSVNFPVIGVNIDIGSNTNNLTDASDYFHRQTVVKQKSDLAMQLKSLTEEILF